jgi:membrane protein DedA with SNARE-associated domain
VILLGDGSEGGVLAAIWEFVKDYPDPVVFTLLILCGVGLPVPEEPILLMAGAVAFELTSGQQLGMEVQLTRMTAVCALGILIGDVLCFHLGRTVGRGIFKVRFVKRIATRPRRVRAERFFQRYGPWSIFIARFFAGVRLVMYFSAGMSHRVSYMRFILMDFLGVLVSVPISIWIGYVVYEQLSDWQAAKGKLGTFHAVLVSGIALGLLVWFVLARKKRAADKKEEATGVVE